MRNGGEFRSVSKGNDITYFLHETNECITVTRPAYFLRGALCGEITKGSIGTIEATNHATGEKAVIQLFTPDKVTPHGKVAGEIFDKDGKSVYSLYGNIRDYISIKQMYDEEIWRMQPYIRNCNQQYYLSELGLLINHFNYEMQLQLPPTDTRFRPDIR